MSLSTFRGTRTPAPTPAPHTGTPEARWRAGAQPTGLPASSPPLSAGGLVVVAAHPEDQVLGAGGLTAQALAAGLPVRVVTVTDGEASHRGAPVPTAVLVARRVREASRALAAVTGAPAGGAVDTVRLRVPDGGIPAHEDALRKALGPLVAGFGLCVAPWRGDGDPDHEATGRAAAEACADTGTGLAEYPLRMWHWAFPGDGRVPWERAYRVELTPLQQARKLRALSCFASQTAPLLPGRDDRVALPPQVLAYFSRPYEVLFRG